MSITYDTIETPVIFRRWTDGSVTALFPTQAADTLGRYCSAFELRGGEQEYEYEALMASTLAAEPEEYRDLAKSVRQHFGYNVQAVNYATDEMHRERRRAATTHRREAMASVRTPRCVAR